jgi:hypothetical protein
MTSPGEVQGVRFLSGAIIDAKPEDAEKLIRSGKAVRVDENGNIIDFHEDDFDNQDAATSATEAEINAEDANGGSDANDSDNAATDADAEETMPPAMTDEQTVEAENDEQPVMAAADDAPSDDAATAEAEPPVSPDDESSDNADNKT